MPSHSRRAGVWSILRRIGRFGEHQAKGPEHEYGAQATGEVSRMTDTVAGKPAAETISRVVVRFAGDSGDGMQLTGDRFTSSSAIFGNDLSTLPDLPAEDRAPCRHVH